MIQDAGYKKQIAWGKANQPKPISFASTFQNGYQGTKAKQQKAALVEQLKIRCDPIALRCVLALYVCMHCHINTDCNYAHWDRLLS
jgi:hypothetical protein